MKLTALSTPLLALSLLVACNDQNGSAPGLHTQPNTPMPAPVRANQAPVVDLKALASTVQAGQPLAFDGSGSRDPEGSTLRLRWDFADGLSGGGPRLAHVFSAAGQYTVRLTATDAQGLSASATQAVTVTAAPAATRTQMTTGRITALDGTALSGVTVSVTGGATAVSDAGGQVSLPLGVGVPQTLRLKRSGFSEQVLNLTLPADSGSDASFTAAMAPQEPALTLVEAGVGGTLTGKDGAAITLPARGLVKADGSAVTGAVQISLTPFDVSQPSAGGFPGLFEGLTPDAARSPIVSLGATDFVLTQNGERVQVAPDQQAGIVLPLYANRRADGGVIAVGDRIPLWSLDDASGLWVQEGEGLVEASNVTPTGLALRATVSHFTPWNADLQIPARQPAPKRKCVYDDDIGIPEAKAQFQTATLCNWLAELDRGVPEQKSARAKASPNPNVARLPTYLSNGYVSTQDDGTGALVPEDVAIKFTVSALNGRFTGTGSLPAARNGQTEVVVKMRPVATDSAGGEDVRLPFDGVRTLQTANTPVRFNFSGTGFRWVRVTVTPEGSQSPPQGSIALFKSGALLAQYNGATTVSRGVHRLMPENGRYNLQITPTSNTPARLRVQIEQVGSDVDETLALPISSINRNPAALTTLRLTLPIEAARTLYLTSKNTESQMRLFAPGGAELFNVEVGDRFNNLPDERSAPMPQTGNAVLQVAARDESGGGFQLGATLSHWLPVTPLLTGFALVDFASDRNDVPTVLAARTSGSGSGNDARTAFSLQQGVNGGWQALGTELGDLRVMTDSAGGAQAALAFDADNAPILLYRADTTVTTNTSTMQNSEYRALRFAQGSWQPLANATGKVTNERGNSRASPRLRVDSQNRPVAALPANNVSGPSVLVTVLDNGQWRALGDATRAGDDFGGEYFDLTGENNGRVYLATASGSGTVVRRFTPSPAPGVWEAVGTNGGLLPQPSEERNAFAPRIALDANDNPIVAGSSQRFTAVWRFDGRAWTNGAASRPSGNDFAGFLTGFALIGPRALMAHVNTVATNSGTFTRPVVQANDAADVTAGLGPDAGAVPQFTPTFAFNRTGGNGRLLNVGGVVYQAIQSSNQMQLLRLTE